MPTHDDPTVAFDGVSGIPGATGGVAAGVSSDASRAATWGPSGVLAAHPIPATLGSIRIREELGRGATGVVHRGRDEMLGRDVAVKFLLGAVLSPDDPGFAAFLKGARAAAGVLHPALTLVHQLGHVGGLPYLVMQYVEGLSVSELLRRAGPGEKPARLESLATLSAVSAGVAALHEAGIIHRDIKPANILISQTGQALVTDFGLAFPARAAVRQASRFGVAGTPAYMAPETFDGEVSPRTDVYALAVTAYQLFTGRLPFDGPSERVRESHLHDPLPTEPLEAALTSLSYSPASASALVDVMERAAAKRPLFRYKGARQFLHALAEACPDLPSGNRATSALLKWVAGSRSPRAEGELPPPSAAASPGPSGTAGSHTSHGSSASVEQPPSSRGDLGGLLKTVRMSRKKLRPVPESTPESEPPAAPAPLPPPPLPPRC